MAKPSEFVSKVRDTSSRLIDAVNDMRSLRREWDALDYGNTLEESLFTDQGGHAGIARADIGNMFAAMEQVEDLLANGGTSVFYKLR